MVLLPTPTPVLWGRTWQSSFLQTLFSQWQFEESQTLRRKILMRTPLHSLYKRNDSEEGEIECEKGKSYKKSSGILLNTYIRSSFGWCLTRLQALRRFVVVAQFNCRSFALSLLPCTLPSRFHPMAAACGWRKIKG